MRSYRNGKKLTRVGFEKKKGFKRRWREDDIAVDSRSTCVGLHNPHQMAQPTDQLR